MEHYNPGLHLLSSFSAPEALLRDVALCNRLFDDLINEHGLVKIGEVYHSFPGSGFTAMVCLTESHLSIHTWPEYGHATFDIFLSNYRQDNSEKVRSIYAAVLEAFEGTETDKQECSR